MKTSSTISWLSGLVCVLAIVAAGMGLFSPGGGEPTRFTTLRGETVTLYGGGLYRNDTLFTASGYKGQDIATLFLGVPLLAVAAWLLRKGTSRSALLYTGIIAYFLYVYASMSLNAAYNYLFLVYVAIFSASFFAFILVFSSIDLGRLPSRLTEKLPKNGPAAFFYASGTVTLVVWLAPLINALALGRPPALLDSYATMVTYALDLAIIMPACFVTASLLQRRSPLGYRLAFPLLGIIIMLLPVISLSTLSQINAGIELSPGEIIGPIAGFGILGLLAIWVVVAILRRIPAKTSIQHISPRSHKGH